MTGTSDAWPEENIKLLVELWGRGHSATQIAEIIPGKTRNAIIGKVRRLKLPYRAPLPAHRKAKPQRPREPRLMTIHDLPPPPPAPKPEPPKPPFVPFMQANEKTCRSIEGHDGTLALFCSNPKIREESYCLYHQGIFYNPLARR